MTINSAMVGASSINWLNSRGDVIPAFEARGQGFEPHPGKLFSIFLCGYFLSFFKKNLEINPKRLF